MTDIKDESSNKAPLAGVKVLDLTHFIAGPFCSMTLGDLGAKVMKVESPHGDAFRNFKPHVGGEGAPFIWTNRNKESIVINLATKEGQDIARQLAAKADILVENFSTGVMKRRGLDYDTLSAANPKLIYCSISAYGREGSMAHRAGFDPVVQADAGFMSMNGHPDREPVRTGPAIMDMTTGIVATNAILAALYACKRDGKGQYVEVSMYDTATTLLGFHAMNYLVSGDDPSRFGNSSPDSAPMDMYHASDGPFYLACATDGLFAKLSEKVLEQPELATCDEFGSARSRVSNRKKLAGVLNDAFSKDTRSVWVEKMRAQSIPAGYPLTIGEALSSTEVKERGLITHIPHPTAKEVPNIASPLQLGRTPVVPPVAAPVLGQHTIEIMKNELGLSEDQIEALVQLGAIGILRS